MQVGAGVQAIQLFDSWAGALSPEDYRRSVLPHSSRVFAALAGAGIPRIHFGVGTGELLGLLGEAGADVVGVDWRVPLDEAVRRVEPGKALQGNLDPAVLLAPWDTIAQRARDVLERGRTAEGHVFNLGHGVLPETDPDMLARLTDLVHAESGPGDGRLAAQAVRGGRLARRRRRPRQAAQAPASAQAAASPGASTASTRNGSSAPATVSSQEVATRRPCQPAARPATNPWCLPPPCAAA